MRDQVRASSYLRVVRLAMDLSLAEVAAAMGRAVPSVWALEQRPIDRVRPTTLERYHAALSAADQARTAERQLVDQAVIDALGLHVRGVVG